jgi:hypothetical protein
MGTSWKTMVAGIVAVLAGVGGILTHLIDGTPIDLTVHFGEIMAGVGLIFAKDWNVTGGTIVTPLVKPTEVEIVKPEVKPEVKPPEEVK